VHSEIILVETRRSPILLVEDSPSDARMLQGMLVDAAPGRFLVTHVSRLGDALEWLRRGEACDVVLLDLSLPDSQGLETVSRLRAQAQLVATVVLTGLDDEALGLESIRLGAQDYLVKGGTDGRLLVRAIGYAVERKRKQVEREQLLDELQRARDELEERVRDRTAELQQTVVALRDEVFARRQAEEAQAFLQEQLHQAQKMEAVGQLAAGLGHDFGNLLTVILACAWRVKNSLHDPYLAGKAVEAVEDAARQAGGIVQSLLTFSSKTPIKKTAVNLCEVLEESAYLLRHTLPAAVELVVTTCPQRIWVYADSVQVEQIFLNLGLNARDAMPDGGKLELSIAPARDIEIGESANSQSPDPEYARLLVRDSGTGIPSEILPRLFEPYFTTKPRGQGTGLGLSIIHGIVRDLGGRIDVLSQVGQGTTFTVLLPCTEAPIGPTEQPVPDLTIREAQGQSVLLIDRNPHSRGIVGTSLRLFGCEVEMAGDDSTVEARCDDLRERLRLIVINEEKCEDSGARFQDKIRSLGIKAPIVLLCGESAVDIEAGDGDKKNVFVLRGPFGMAELSRVVAAALSVR
jgi:two-component system, cell cycle sensor histidine kinase and response regulator CckA